MSMSASSCRVGFRDNYIFDRVYVVYFLAKILQAPLKPRWKLPKVSVVSKTSSGFIIRKERTQFLFLEMVVVFLVKEVILMVFDTRDSLQWACLVQTMQMCY